MSGTSVLPQVVSAHIDWITATARPDGNPDELLRVGKGAALQERAAGNRLRQTRWRDYQGWQCGRVFLGERRDSSLVRVESELADAWAPALATYCSNITRFDLACTWRLAGDSPREWIRRRFDDWSQPARRGRASLPGLVLSAEDGATLTMGARTSQVYGRVYAKGPQSHGRYPADALRAELEIKPRDSTPLRLNVANGLFTPARILSEVGDWMRARGVDCGLQEGQEGTVLEFPARETDAERTLVWLREQVAPAVARCVAVVGMPRVVDALGLPRQWTLPSGLTDPGPRGPDESHRGST